MVVRSVVNVSAGNQINFNQTEHWKIIELYFIGLYTMRMSVFCVIVEFEIKSRDIKPR